MNFKLLAISFLFFFQTHIFAAEYKNTITLKGHTDKVSSVAFSHDGSRVITGSWDKTARVWDVKTGKQLQVLKGHTNTVYLVRFSHDSSKVLTAASMAVKRWNASTGELLATISDCSYFDRLSLFYCDDLEIKDVIPLKRENNHSIGFNHNRSKIVTGSYDKTARIWNAVTGNLLQILKGHVDIVADAQFSPDDSKIVTVSYDKTVRIWDSIRGKLLHTLGKPRDLKSSDFTPYTYGFNSAQFSPNSSLIVTGSSDKTARIWSTFTGKLLLTLKGHTDEVTSVAFSPDGSQIITGSGDKTAKVWKKNIPEDMQVEDVLFEEEK